MPPPRTIIVDVEALYAAIASAWQADCVEAACNIETAEETQQAAHGKNLWANAAARSAARHYAELLALGTRYDLERFAGRALTASERIRHQQAVRSLEAAGKVERIGQRIKPTKEGPNDA